MRFVLFFFIAFASFCKLTANPFININQQVFLPGETITGKSYFTSTDGYTPNLNGLTLLTESDDATGITVSIIYSNVIQQPPNYLVLETEFEFSIPEDFASSDTLFYIHGSFSKNAQTYEAETEKIYIVGNLTGMTQPSQPENNTVNVSLNPLLIWTNDRFYGSNPRVRLQLSESESFADGTIVVDTILYGLKYAVQNRLNENTEYFWRLSLYRGVYAYTTGETFKFTTGEKGEWTHLTVFPRKINNLEIAEQTGFIGIATDTSVYYSFDFFKTWSQRQSNYKPPVYFIKSNNDKIFYYTEKHTAYSYNESIVYDVSQNTFTSSVLLDSPTAFDASPKGGFLAGSNRGYTNINKGGEARLDTTVSYQDTNVYVSAVKIKENYYKALFAALAFRDEPDAGKLFVKTENDEYWRRLSGFPDMRVSDIDETVEGALIVCGTGNKGSVFLTTDLGATWMETADGLPDGGVRLLEIDSRGNFYAIAQGDNKIYLSEDYGKTWNDFSDGLADGTEIDFVAASLDSIIVAANKDGDIFIRKTGDVFGLVKFPEDDAEGVPTELTIRWHENKRAATYHLQMYGEAVTMFLPNEDEYNFIIDDSTITSPYYTPSNLQTDTYYHWRVRAKTKFGWGGWSEFSNFSTVTSSVGDVIDDGKISIYPNPANNFINIRLPESIAGNINITLNNYRGETAAKYLFYSDRNAGNPIRIETNGLSSGVYFLTIISGKEIFHGKFNVIN